MCFRWAALQLDFQLVQERAAALVWLVQKSPVQFPQEFPRPDGFAWVKRESSFRSPRSTQTCAAAYALSTPSQEVTLELIIHLDLWLDPGYSCRFQRSLPHHGSAMNRLISGCSREVNQPTYSPAASGSCNYSSSIIPTATFAVLALDHPPSDSAAETPIYSAYPPGVIFVLWLVRIKRTMTT